MKKKDAIARADYAINAYKEMKDFINEKMKTLPAVLKTYVQVTCPIYDDGNY